MAGDHQYGTVHAVKYETGIEPGDIEIHLDEDADPSDEEEAIDLLIEELLDDATSLIDRFCNRDFSHHENDTVTVDGNGRNSMRLPRQWPIIEIHSIKIGGSEIDSDTYRVRPGRDLAEWNSGVIDRKNSIWPEGFENIEIELDWGFEEVPLEIDDVAEGLAAGAILEFMQNQSVGGAQSISMDGYSVTYPDRMRLDEDRQRTLNEFKPIEMG